MISDYNVTPAVLMPGDMGTIQFTIRTTDPDAKIEDTSAVTSGSSGKTRTTGISVFIHNIHVEGNGVTILSGDFDRVGDLGPGQSLPITVLFKAPENEGMFFPEIWIDTGTGLDVDGSSTRYPVPVNVNTRIALLKKPDILLEKTLPATVVPGDGFSAALKIRNDGYGRADDLYVTVNASLASLSLASPSEYHIDHLAPGENVTCLLNFISDTDSALGIRPVPVTVRYANADGSEGIIRDELGIPMKGNATLAIKSLTLDPVRPGPGDAITLVLRIENTGTDRATSVKTVLDTTLSGTTEAFIGSIDKDSDAPAIFYLRAPAYGGEIPVTVNVTWSDDYGAHEFREKTVVIVSGSSAPWLWVVVLILAGFITGGVYWYLRIYKKGDHA
jgi:uncharacterized membrane protein